VTAAALRISDGLAWDFTERNKVQAESESSLLPINNSIQHII